MVFPKAVAVVSLAVVLGSCCCCFLACRGYAGRIVAERIRSVRPIRLIRVTYLHRNKPERLSLPRPARRTEPSVMCLPGCGSPAG
jgi:hypothetical protein